MKRGPDHCELVHAQCELVHAGVSSAGGVMPAPTGHFHQSHPKLAIVEHFTNLFLICLFLPRLQPGISSSTTSENSVL